MPLPDHARPDFRQAGGFGHRPPDRRTRPSRTRALRSNLAGAATSDSAGYYYLPLLSPGFYQIRVTAPAYQSQEVQEIELTVAARVELDFRMRPLSDVWESGEYRSVFLPGSKTIVTFFGPDVDPSKTGSFEAQKGRRGALESTVSEVIDSGEINNLPLAGRDVYTMLVTAAGRHFRRRNRPRPGPGDQRPAAVGFELSCWTASRTTTIWSPDR